MSDIGLLLCQHKHIKHKSDRIPAKTAPRVTIKAKAGTAKGTNRTCWKTVNAIHAVVSRASRKVTVASHRVRYALVALGNIAQVGILPGFLNAKANSELVAMVSGDV